ncbi:MAG: HlyD family efflux transporter periplasmic adaptor subunit [Oscillospiraceae bacterium]|jgi:biotin carboxyl carrier protein|nr:HlyD family efflux transporter periplasmic adaptor subunit [Oscillospiraceae bacterium]
MVRRIAALGVGLVVVMGLSFAAGAGESPALTLYGEVAPGVTVSAASPIGGYVDGISATAGDIVADGAALLEVRGAAVTAPCDGTVRLAGAGLGLDASTLAERYGAALYIEPANAKIVKADTGNAYVSEDNKTLRVGERVYLASREDSGLTGTGFIAQVSGKAFTIELDGGNLPLDEKVRVYRDEARTPSLRIGQGTVARNPDVPVKASDVITAMYVGQGDAVARGQLLMETGKVNGQPLDSTIRAREAAIVASVEVKVGAQVSAGQSLATLYPLSGLVVQVPVPERDLDSIKIGGEVGLEFQSGGGVTGIVGTVAGISGLSVGEEGDPRYMVSIEYEDGRLRRVGMSVTVVVGGE